MIRNRFVLGLAASLAAGFAVPARAQDLTPTGLQCYCKDCKTKKSLSACYMCCNNKCGSSAAACQNECDRRPNCSAGGGDRDVAPADIDGLRTFDLLPNENHRAFLAEGADILERGGPMEWERVLRAERLALKSEDLETRRIALLMIGEAWALGAVSDVEHRDYIAEVVETWMVQGDRPMQNIAAKLVAEYSVPVCLDCVLPTVVELLSDPDGQRPALRILARASQPDGLSAEPMAPGREHRTRIVK